MGVPKFVGTLCSDICVQYIHAGTFINQHIKNVFE